MQSGNKKIRNRTMEESVKDIVRNAYSICVARPRRIINLLKDTSVLDGPTYFPDRNRRSRYQILWDQIRNIICHEDIEEYYYLYGCDVMSRREQKSFTPYMKFLRRRNRLNFRSEHNASCILRDKLFFGSIAKTLGIDTPENVGITDPSQGDVIDLNSSRKVQIIDFLKGLDGMYFCKPIDGECGRGIAVLQVESGCHDCVFFDGQKLPMSEISRRLSSITYLIQKKIVQHPEISRLYPMSINTVRLVTVRDINTGEIKVFPSVLRIGNLGNTVDNFSLGGVIVNLDTNSGKLEKYGFMKSQFGTVMTHHPFTGIEFGSVTVPYIREAIRDAIRFHSFLDLHSIGWDIAITESGPCFIEGNDNWEIDVQQNALHPLDKYFKKYFYRQ